MRCSGVVKRFKITCEGSGDLLSTHTVTASTYCEAGLQFSSCAVSGLYLPFNAALGKVPAVFAVVKVVFKS